MKIFLKIFSIILILWSSVSFSADPLRFIFDPLALKKENQAQLKHIHDTKNYLINRNDFEKSFLLKHCSPALVATSSNPPNHLLNQKIKPQQDYKKTYDQFNKRVVQCYKSLYGYMEKILPKNKRSFKRYLAAKKNSTDKDMLNSIDRCLERQKKVKVFRKIRSNNFPKKLDDSLKNLKQQVGIISHKDCTQLDQYEAYINDPISYSRFQDINKTVAYLNKKEVSKNPKLLKLCLDLMTLKDDILKGNLDAQNLLNQDNKKFHKKVGKKINQCQKNIKDYLDISLSRKHDATTFKNQEEDPKIIEMLSSMEKCMEKA
ncbi:MAG: hypothetical protein ACR2M7_02745, partial [Bdellovibrionales bacterium]